MSFERELRNQFEVAADVIDPAAVRRRAISAQVARRRLRRRSAVAALSLVVITGIGFATLGNQTSTTNVVADPIVTDGTVEPISPNPEDGEDALVVDDVATDKTDSGTDDPNGAESKVGDSDSAEATKETVETAPSVPLPIDEAASNSLLTEANFNYVGAFTVPTGYYGPSRFSYSSGVAAFNPDGDPANTDGYAGSLFVSGHNREQSVAEISIPAPQTHNGSPEGLPQASVLQPFADVTGGRGTEYIGGTSAGGLGEFRIGGLEVESGPNGPRLYWSAWQYYNVGPTLVPGHGHSSLDLANPSPEGPWFVGDYHDATTAGYTFAVPTAFADDNLGGNRFVSGKQLSELGPATSRGPPFIAHTPFDQAPAGSKMQSLELANYVFPDYEMPGYQEQNWTAGAAWVQNNSGDRAIVTVGRRAIGPAQARQPATCGATFDFDFEFAPDITFYDPADLARVANGELDPWAVTPYRTWSPAKHLFPTCDWMLGSISVDQSAGLIYITQVQADTSQNQLEPVPVVHVFKIS